MPEGSLPAPARAGRRRILILEDDTRLTEALSLTLREEYEVGATVDPEEALRLLRSASYFLALVDERLPRGNGLQFIRAAREEYPGLSIVVITAQATKELAVACLNLGVSRFLEKPFSLTHLRRTIAELEPPPLVELADQLRLNTLMERVERGEDDLGLTPLEYKIFSQVALAGGAIVSRRTILREVWGDCAVSEHALDTHLSAVKKKLGAVATCLRTERGKGFRWEKPVDAGGRTGGGR